MRFTNMSRPSLVRPVSAAIDNAPQKVRTDAEGRFRADGLIPDVKYFAQVMQGRYPRGVFADLALTSGQAKDLGDVMPKKARDAE